MNLTDGNLYFKKVASPKMQYSYLYENIKCDVLVIGGGISGAITAYYLAKERVDVVLIDKNIVGHGSTLSANNILQAESNIDMCKLSKIIGDKKTKKYINLCLNSINELEKIIKDISKEVDIEKINFKRCDSIYYTNKYMNRGNVFKEYTLKNIFDINPEIIEGHDLLNVKYGMRIKNYSAIINGYEFVQKMVEYLSKQDNVRIFENTEAIDIKSKEDDVDVITHNKFKIRAKRVVITEGVEVLKKFPDMPIDIYRIFTIITEPLKNIKKEYLDFTARDIDLPCHNVRFTEDGRIVFCGEKVKINEKNKDEKIMREISNLKYRKLFKALQENINIDEEIVVKYCFNGTTAETKDFLPIIDEIPSCPNVFCNLSYGINGTLNSIIGAKMLKEINREYYARDMYLFRIRR